MSGICRPSHRIGVQKERRDLAVRECLAGSIGTQPLMKCSIEYKVLGKVGEGSFSEVLKCQDRETGVLYAAKRLKKIKQTITEVLQIPEVVAMRKIKEHPNVLHMIESHFDPLPGKVTLIFELMDMSMYDLLKSRKRCLPESRVKNYLYQILKAVDHLHQHGLFHRDIKPENILLKIQTELVKLADLGSVRGIFCRPPYTEYISTRWYRSPECLLTTGFYGPKMDVWATGCVFFELLTLKPLFPGANEVDQLSKIHNILGTPNQHLIAKFRRHKSQNCQYIFPAKSGTGLYNMLSNASEAGQDILRHMLVYDPKLRSNTRRLLEHRYFNDLREKEILFPRRRSWSVNSNSNSKNIEWRNPVLLSYMMASEKRRKHKRISTNRHSTEKKPVPRVVVSSPSERCSPQNALQEAAARQKLLKHTLGVTEITKHPPPCQYSHISKLKQGEPIHSEVVHLPNIVQQKIEKGNSPPIAKKPSVLNRPARVPNTITSLPVLETSIKDRHKTASNSFLHLPPLVKKLDPNLHSNMRNPRNGVQPRPGVVSTLATIEESPTAKKLHHDLQVVVNYNIEFKSFVTGWPGSVHDS